MTRLSVLFLLGAIACGRPVAPGTGTAGGVFPHVEAYEDAHGADAVAAGANCGSCHGLAEGDLVKGVTPTAPACQSCHAYPHAGAFRGGEAHGAAWAADTAACAECHGAAGDQAPAEQAAGRCISCHASFPHVAGWDEGSSHGAAVRARGSALACESCHGEDGDAVEPTCASCHANYPHPDGWGYGTVHGAAATDALSCGETCHSNVEGDGLDRQPCSSCHDVYPHPEGWASGHATLTQRRGAVACEGCHPTGELVGPALPVSCGPACHASEAR